MSIAFATALLVPWTGAEGQSVTAGAVTGTVRDSAGSPLRKVIVTLTERATGLRRVVDVDSRGAFSFWLLPLGEYQAAVEALGFRPTRVVGIQVEPGASTAVDVVLEPVVLPVTEAAKRSSTALGGGLSAAGVDLVASSLELKHSPGEPFSLDAAGAFLPTTGLPLSADGLPGSMARFVIDGVPWETVRNPWLQVDPGPALPTWALDRVQFSANDVDVEWSGFAAGQLIGFSRRGSQPASVEAFGDWSGDLTARLAGFSGTPPRFGSWRGGLLVGAPLIPDTAQVQLGIEGQRQQTPLPGVWSDPVLGSAIAAVALDSFGVSLAPYVAPRVASLSRIRPFGKLDWQLGESHALSVLAGVDLLSADDPDLGDNHAPGVGAKLKAHSFGAGTTLSSVLSRKVWNEVRVVVDGSAREYDAPAVPPTRIVDAGVLLGADPAGAGRFKRAGVNVSEAATFMFGEHRLKVGGGAELGTYVYTFAYRRAGEYVFGSVGDLAARRGSYTQTVSAVPTARFATGSVAGFAQDVWTVAPGFDLQVGMRFEAEFLPWARVALNGGWLAQTGLDNTNFKHRHQKISPRAGFVWRVGKDGSWVVRGQSGVFYDAVDPGLLDEMVTNSGKVETRRGVGVLGKWPAAPDSTAAPVVGRQLTLLGPNFLPPRSGRASLGLSWFPGPRSAVHASAGVRRTGSLSRRHDLNRLAGITGRDQYGRPLYGKLTQLGSLLTAQPGTNRRFSQFDLVSALDPDGLSDYWDLTLGVERRVGALRFSAWYTYSRATDNWLASEAGGPEGQLSPFPDSLSGRDWADGRSDFDVPHQYGVVAELSPFRGGSAALSVRYAYRAGRPFTPGFRPGVDANGDGSATNDPAFVDDRMSGMDQLLGAWPCLGPFVGRFVERNACQEPGAHRLDLRVTIRPVRVETLSVALVIDGLNLLDEDTPVRDRALYLIDASRALTTASATGVVTVPLTANPGFGQVVERRGSGRLLRIGIRIG